MDEKEYFGNIGGVYEEEQADRLKECVTLIAEKREFPLKKPPPQFQTFCK